ncbi:MAG: hypothetical protein AAGK04_10200 [Planctomycetota bacterium]
MRLMWMALALLAVVSGAWAQTRPVEYTVRLEAPQTQVVTIEARFPEVAAGAFDVHLPVWRPGLYLVLDNAGSIRRITATDGAGDALPIAKTRKSSWRVDASSFRGREDVIVTCEIYANSIGNRTRHVDDTHAFLSGSSVFLFAEPMRDRPIEIQFEKAGPGAAEGDQWRLASGLERVGERRLRAPSYDILVDSPIEYGLHERIEFEVNGKAHSYVVWGRFAGDTERMVEDTAAIIREHERIFGDLPYEEYVFLTHSMAGLRGGTEHYNSTVLSVDPRTWHDDERYEGFMSLVVHEHFHTWNVKRFRPSEIDRYEYLKESYTELLWIVEGTTSYYDELVLPRAGVIDADAYLERLAGNIDGYRRTPGRLVQPLSESSYDAWIKLFHRGSDRTADRANSQISFYLKGALVSMALDLLIRQDSNNARSLDDVMRALYEQFPLGEGGYTNADVRRIVRGVAPGVDLDAFFASWVEGVTEVDFESLLGIAGLELTPPNDDEEPQWYLGVNLASDGTVRSTRSDGPAYGAGLIAGDELVAVNDLRVGGGSTGSFQDLVDREAPNGPLQIAFFRREELWTIEVEAIERPGGEWKIGRMADATPVQRAAYAAWLGVEWQDPATDTASEEAGD